MASISELGAGDLIEPSTQPTFPVVIIEDDELRIVSSLGDFPYGVNFKIVLQSPFSFEDFAELANRHTKAMSGVAVAEFHRKNSKLRDYDEHDDYE